MGEPSKYKFFSCLVYILLASGPVRCNAENQSSHLEKPVDWDRLCPFTDLCNHKAIKEIKLGPNEVPCCETCSCDPDCGLKRNCCLYSMDRYRLDERYHTSCTMFSTYTKQFSTGIGYNVVDQCANFTPCTSKYETPLGSLYPVYSPTSDMIFMNEECAVCNGETETVKWNVEISCETEIGDSNIVEKSKALLRGSEENCNLKFTPPKHTYVRRHTCIDDPSGQAFDCLTNNSDSHRVMEELCMSFNASFTSAINGYRYNNIFCHLCTIKYDVSFRIETLVRSNVHICKIDETTRGPAGQSLSLLLSPDKVMLLSQKWSTKNEDQPGCDGNVVVEKESDRCRKIRCPEGQIEVDQICTYISNDWLTGPITALLRLEPVSPKDIIPEKHLKVLSARKGKIFKTHLDSWTHLEYFRYQTVNNGSYVKYFLVWLLQNNKEFDPVTFMFDFQTDLKSAWIVRVNGEIYNFEANFNIYYKYVYLPIDYKIVSETDISLNESEILQSIRPGVGFRGVGGVVLTKFFFCEQVDLESDEYVDYGIRIYFNVTDRLLQEAEFRRKHNFDGTTSIISVCIEDFGEDFWKPRRSAHPPALTTDMSVYMALVAYSFVKC